MIYTVECAFSDPAREADWNAYYSGPKLAAVLSVPGFRTSQRFRAITPCAAPYYAMHSLRDADVLGAQYKGVGGGSFGGGWDEMIYNWHRNLFAGLDMAPDVPMEACLLVLDDPADNVTVLAAEFCWLDIAGLDRSVTRRGLAVVDRAAGEKIAATHGEAMRLFEPMTERKWSSLETG
ncbi:MAG: sugar ABC transporter [Alphaproteobacteria bacterium]|nr:sugar ABC transporter [Alphaproteobacteria bacterium]